MVGVEGFENAVAIRAKLLLVRISGTSKNDAMIVRKTASVECCDRMKLDNILVDQ